MGLAGETPADQKVAIVIGSGFAGAVTAYRLAQHNARMRKAGQHSATLKIILLERGRRYGPSDFPRMALPGALDPDAHTSKRLPDTSRMLWANDLGLWDVRNLGGLQVAQAAGYGGGSLIYASVHLRAPEKLLETWPKGFQRQDLDPHYREVERLLQTRPAPEDRWVKTDRLRQAAKTAGWENTYFRPPVAITFDEPGLNAQETPVDPAFGPRRPCNGCGNCTIGCQEGAKNTLNFNYLAEAERLGVSMRTLKEVEAIEREGSGYKLHIHDHLTDAIGSADTATQTAYADYVFLCAGALGSTELLMRSRQRLRGEEPNTDDRLDNLGKRFFGNGDALGVAFDTREAWEPAAGPTITGSLYIGHNEPQLSPKLRTTHTSVANTSSATIESATVDSNRARDWFLIQEGGIPPSLAACLPFLKSPVWGGRNRFAWDNPGAAPLSSASAGSGPPAAKSKSPRESLLAKLTQAAKRPGLFATALGLSGKQTLDMASRWVPRLPPAFQNYVEDLVALADPDLRSDLRTTTNLVLDRMSTHSWIIGVYLRLAGRKGTHKSTQEVISEQLPLLKEVLAGQRSMPEVVDALLSALLLPEPARPHTALFLAMGPDEPWKLSFEAPHEAWLGQTRIERRAAVRAHRPTGTGTLEHKRIYRLQERALRDLARATGGELRTNPAWSIGKKPITVHAQGGCNMGPESDDQAVTDLQGQVYGYQGLYVMDAALFPSSVGVNPSHTIAALADKQACTFVRDVLGQNLSKRNLSEQAEPPDKPNGEPAIGPGHRELEALSQSVEGFDATPIHFAWKERLGGFASATALAQPHTTAERTGRLAGSRLAFELEIDIPDLDGYLANPDLGESAVMSLGGSDVFVKRVEEGTPDGSPDNSFPVGDARYAVVDRKAYLEALPKRPLLQVTGSLEITQGDQAERWTVDSETSTLELAVDNKWRPAQLHYQMDLLHPSGQERMRCEGWKDLRNEQGLDAWLDSSTLFVDFYALDPHGVIGDHKLRGIVRVSLRDFMTFQLPSFEVKNEDLGPQRKAWAVLRFSRFFFGSLARVYAQEIF